MKTHCAIVGTTQTIAWASSYYMPAILGAPIAGALHLPTSVFFGLFSGALLLSWVVGPSVGRLIDRHGGRVLLATSNLVIAAGLVILAASHGIAGLVVAWAVLGVGIGMGALVPLMALSLAARGIDAAVIGLNAAMFPLAVLLVGPLLPRLLARLGTLRGLYLGLSLTALTVLLMPALPGLGAWFALRFLSGAAASIQWVISETWLNIIATERDRGRIMGLYASVLAAGFAIGPLR